MPQLMENKTACDILYKQENDLKYIIKMRLKKLKKEKMRAQLLLKKKLEAVET